MFNMNLELNQFTDPPDKTQIGEQLLPVENNNTTSRSRVAEQNKSSGGSVFLSCPSCGQPIDRALVARSLGAAGGRKSRRKLTAAEIQALKDARARKLASIPREAI